MYYLCPCRCGCDADPLLHCPIPLRADPARAHFYGAAMSDTIDASHAVDTSPAPESTQHRWATTEKARTESGINAVALSVRQRKLLTLLATPQTAQVLAERSNTPLADVQAALNRFATLGLAQSDAPRVASVTRAAQVRATPAAKVYRTNATRLPLALGAIALTTAGLMVWFFARPATQPTAATPNVATTAVNAQATPTPNTSAQPSATNSATSPASLSAPSTSAVDTAGAAGVAGTAAQRAAAAAIKEAAAKVATKDAGTAATKSAANAPPAAAVNADPRAQTAAATAPAGASVLPSATSATPAPPAAAAAPTTTTVAAPAATVSPTLVASVAPSPTAPAAAAAATPAKAATPVVAREGRLLERVEPAYPRNVQYENGTVRARLSVNAAGAVTGVEIISANPPRVFDRSVSTALAQWKYEATGEASSKLVEVSFQR